MSEETRGILSIGEASRLDREPLAITAKAIAKSLHQGSHRAAGAGGATEFYDARPYAPGDPVRMIDWKAMGRSDRLYLKRFEQESQLGLSIVIDASASMRYADEGGPTKLQRACEIAASLAYLACAQGDRVGVTLLDASRNAMPLPSQGWGAFARAVTEMRAALDRDEPPVPAPSFSESAAQLRPEGDLVVLLTDGLEDPGPIVAGLAQLAGRRGRDLRYVQVLTQTELDPSPLGAGRFVDPESGEQVVADANAVRDAYRERFDAHRRAIESAVRSVRGVYCLATTNEDAIRSVRALAGPR